ncbi:MAG: hypothetical protein LPK08_09115, partial [Halomonas sp.]|nr:hypothetical protein [Halomonas sp.]
MRSYRVSKFLKPQGLADFINILLGKNTDRIEFIGLVFSSDIPWDVFNISLNENVKHITFKDCCI